MVIDKQNFGMKTGKLVKQLRIEKGMTQEELAHQTEVSTRTIQRIENGDVDPRAYSLQMIAKALDVDYSLFVNENSDEDREMNKVNNSNWLALLHLSGIFPLFIPTIMIWNHKKGKIPGINEHYRSVMRFQLTIIGAVVACLWVYWKAHQLTPLMGVLLSNVLFSITNTMKVISGDSYIKPPFMKNKN